MRILLTVYEFTMTTYVFTLQELKFVVYLLKKNPLIYIMVYLSVPQALYNNLLVTLHSMLMISRIPNAFLSLVIFYKQSAFT